MNRGELRTLFLEYADDPNGDRWQTNSANRLLNNALSTLQNNVVEADEGFFSGIVELTVTTADNDSLEFDLPSDFVKLIQLERLTSTTPVEGYEVNFQNRHRRVDWRDYRVGKQSAPAYYVRGDKVGIVDPTESYTARVYYTKKLPEMEDDIDVPEFPLEYHELIALHAARIAYGIQGDAFPLEKYYQEEYQKLIRMVEGRVKQAPRYVNIHADDVL